MRQVIASSGLIGLALTLVMSAALLGAGRGRPMGGISHWRLDECAIPCWVGIVPGQTSIQEAQRRIQARFPILKVAGQGLPADDASDSQDIALPVRDASDASDAAPIAFILRGTNSTVDTLALEGDWRDEMPSLGEIIAAFGAPSCMAEEGAAGTLYIRLFYVARGLESPQMTVDTTYPLYWSKPIRAVTMLRPAADNAGCQGVGQGGFYPWSGFQSIAPICAEAASYELIPCFEPSQDAPP